MWQKTKPKLGLQEGAVKWLRKHEPDLIVISQGANKDGLEWMRFCREAGLPYVTKVSCNSETWWPDDKTAGEMAAVYRDASKVFCISRPNLKMLEHQIGERLSNAAVVWSPNQIPIAEPVAWPVTNDIWKMACVARLEPGPKGQDLLFQVLDQSRWRERPVELNLYGEGPCERSLRRWAEQSGLSQVHFRGHVADRRKIWEENHLLVLSSRYEGIPTVLMEAMWCGRAAVATNVGRVDEMCVDGETGFVVPAPAVDLLDQALERAWERRKDWRKMGQAARARAERLISADPVGDFCGQLMECVERQKTEIVKQK
jgi:glycosyltransferase involved in cell wall biosynthesis